MEIFDAHLDLAYLAECGRDMEAGLESCGGPHLPAAVTFPSLREGGVTGCLGTIFTQAVPDVTAPGAATGTYTYPLGDAEAAHQAGVRQLDRYHDWARRGLVRLMPRRKGVKRRFEGPDEAGEVRPLEVGILMECADPIRSPDELEWWAERGVVAIGLTWVHQGRYAGGNGVEPGDPAAGLTDQGRALVRAMDALGVAIDLSHLSQRATDQVLEMTSGPVIASHSNARALFDRDVYPNARPRHLSDETIREIGRRGGVIGLNLYSPFLDVEAATEGSARLECVVRHLEHLLKISGTAKAVGLGTDMDGGFSAERLPVGVRRPRDVQALLAEFHAQGLDSETVANVAEGSWRQFWGW